MAMNQQELARAIAWHQQGRLSEAEAGYLTCLAQDSTNRDATYYLAGLRQQQGLVDEAERLLRGLVARKPDDGPAWLRLGVVARERGGLDAAVSCFERARQLQDANPAAHYNLGVTLAELGRAHEALVCFERAIVVQPGYAIAHANRGATLARMDRWADALASCERALALNPALVDAHANRGLVLVELGRLLEALESFRETLALAPGHVDAWLGRGTALRRLGRLEEAEDNWRQALAQSANAQRTDASARSKYCNHLGVALLDRGQIYEAQGSFRQALADAPDFLDAQFNLLRSVDLAGDPDASMHSHADALRRFPNNAEFHALYGKSLMAAGRPTEALAAYRQAVALEPGNLSRRSAVISTLLYLPDTGERELHSETQAFDRAARAKSAGELPAAQRVQPAPDVPPDSPQVSAKARRKFATGNRLRIGYVSADLRQHSVAYFLEPVLEFHDRARVEIFCYSSSSHEDHVTARIKSHSEHWRACPALSDPELARLIESDGIDILIDLSGHTAGNRLGLFATRPAPLQLSWLGFPGDTGLSAIDGYLGDALVAPQEANVVRLAPTFSCYRPAHDAPDVAPAPAQKNGYVTFGSFNNLAKLSEPAVALWSRLLHEVPDSRLVLKHHALSGEGTAEWLRSRFQMQGIAPWRLQMLPWDASLGAHYRHYDVIDIGLDPFPYCGVTTTCEALWMGVPVVSLVGERFAGRVGLSLLSAIGHPEWAVTTENDYIKQVAALSSSPLALAELRSDLRRQVADSALTDARGFTATLEGALMSLAADPVSKGIAPSPPTGNCSEAPTSSNLPAHFNTP